MSVTPIFNSPCDLAQRLPSMISEFLDLENKIGRRFREDSVTDIIIASLLKVAGSNATVFVPPEVKTGGDFDLLIVEPSTGGAIRYRIQSKRLSPHAKNWGWSSYRELDHPHGKGGQSATLVRSSASEKVKTIPLYAFYNPESVCRTSGGLITGIELADGYQIRRIIKILVKAKAADKRPYLKRVEKLRHLFFPLSTILCPAAELGQKVGRIVSPLVSQRSVEAAIETRRGPAWMDTGQAPQIAPFAQENSIADVVQPARVDVQSRWTLVVEKAIARTENEEPIRVARVKRPTIVLISRDVDAPQMG